MEEKDILNSPRLVSAFQSLVDKGVLDLAIPNTQEEAQKLFQEQSSSIQEKIKSRMKELEERKEKKSKTPKEITQLGKETMNFSGYEDVKDEIGDGMYIAAMIRSQKTDLELVKMYALKAEDNEKAKEQANNFRDHYVEDHGHKSYLLGYLDPDKDGIKFQVLLGECICALNQYTDCSYKKGKWIHEYNPNYSSQGKSPFGKDTINTMTAKVMANIELPLMAYRSRQ